MAIAKITAIVVMIEITLENSSNNHNEDGNIKNQTVANDNSKYTCQKDIVHVALTVRNLFLVDTYGY